MNFYRWLTKKFNSFDFLFIGHKYPKGNKTWSVQIGAVYHYLCRSKTRPERLIACMHLVPDFYICKFWGFYYCYWTSEPTKGSTYPGKEDVRISKTLPPFKMADYNEYLDEIRRKGR